MDFVEYEHKEYPKVIREKSLGAASSIHWKDPIHTMLVEMQNTGIPVHILQLKEKFGSLCVYYQKSDETSFSEDETDTLFQIVARAQKACANICAECGSTNNAKVGYKKDSGWLSVLCEAHRDESNYEE